MKYDLKKRLNSIISKGVSSISLETVFKDRNTLITEHIEDQNRIASGFCAMLTLFENVFWTVFSFFGRDNFGLDTPYGIIGLAVTTIASVFMLIAIKKTNDEKRTKLFNNALVTFRFSIILGVLFLAISRCCVLSKLGATSFSNGISLSTLQLFVLLFIPTRRKRDSSILIAALAIGSFIPEFICQNGTYFLIEELILRCCVVIGLFAFRAITLRNATMIEDLADASYFDFQTRTLNRKALSEYLESVQGKSIERIGVMMYDIDDFKSYNDEYSHKNGDEVLKKVCESVNKVLENEKALTFRYGSGEFVSIIEDVSDEHLIKTALQIRDAVQNLNLERKDGTLRDYITITVGCAASNLDELTDRDLLGDVDTQLFIGKRGTKNCVVYKGRIFIAEGEISAEQEPTQYTDRVAQAVSEAMKNNEIVAYYQPLYDTMTQGLVGAEALSRWVKSDGTVILPGEYIPELEKNSSILALDWYMFTQVCKMLKRQSEMGIKQVRISVNFSRMHALYERNIERRLCEIADSYGIAHNLIEIEITESAYIRLPNIIEPFIKAIRAEGFAVAVDDFGSGASSLGLVKSVDIDTLKIDKSLISSNCEDEKERVLLESVIYLAHRLGLVSVAEGVETQEQLGFLKSLRCSHIQGFIFARPMPEDDFMKECTKKDSTITAEGQDISDLVKDTPIQLLIDSVFRKYPIAIMANVTQNTFYAKTKGNFIDHQYPQSGRYTDLLDELCKTMHPEDVPVFKSCFSLENHINAAKQGESRLSLKVRLHGDNDPQYKDVEITSYFVKDRSIEDVFVISLCTEAPLL